LLCVLPPLWKDIFPTAKQRPEQADFLSARSRSGNLGGHRKAKLRRLGFRRSGCAKCPQSRESLGAGALQSRKFGLGRFDLGGKLFLAGHSESIVAPADVHGKRDRLHGNRRHLGANKFRMETGRSCWLGTKFSFTEMLENTENYGLFRK
jgi:hypothetical protein